jgi:hypothetical protein
MLQQPKKKDLANEAEINQASAPVNNTEPKIETGETAEITKSSAAPASDPFDLANLRLDQSFIESAGVKKLITTIPVTKPHDQQWFRVHPNKAYRETFAMILLKDEREYYLVLPHIARALPNEFIMVHLFTVITRQGTLFLWPIKLPGPNDKMGTWYTSAMDAADFAMTHWTRIKWSKPLMAYEHWEAPPGVPDPEWPDLPFTEMLRVAFRDHYVDKIDHAVIKALHCAI